MQEISKYFFGKEEHLLEITFILNNYILIRNINDFSIIEERQQILISDHFDENWKDLNLLFFITKNLNIQYFIFVNEAWLKDFFSKIYNTHISYLSPHESIWSQIYKTSLVGSSVNYKFQKELDFVKEIFPIMNKHKEMSRLWHSFLLTGDENLIYYYLCLEKVRTH